MNGENKDGTKSIREIIKAELTDKWFLIYSLSVIFLPIISYFLPWKTFKIIAFVCLPIIQFVYNIKSKESQQSSFSKTLNWIFFILWIIFSIAYISVITNEAIVGLIFLLIIPVAIAISTIIVSVGTSISLLKNPKNLWSILIAYLLLTIVIILIFSLLYFFFTVNEQNKILDRDNNKISGFYNFFYFSTLIYYSNNFGETPYGLSKFFSILEITLSYIFHIIIIGYSVNSIGKNEN